MEVGTRHELPNAWRYNPNPAARFGISDEVLKPADVSYSSPEWKTWLELEAEKGGGGYYVPVRRRVTAIRFLSWMAVPERLLHPADRHHSWVEKLNQNRIKIK